MSKENVEIVRRLYGAAQAMSRDELVGAVPELIRRFADPEIVWVESSRIDGRTHRGHDGVRQAVEHWLANFDRYRFEISEIVDCGDEVLVIGHEEGRGTKSGAVVSAESFQVFTVRDGRISRFRGFSDEDSAREAAGLSKQGPSSLR
jgi:uncharacterized protein